MRIGQVIGTVTLSRWNSSVSGATWKLVVPLSLKNLQQQQPATAEALVAIDLWGSGIGQLVAFSEGGEAAQPFQGSPKPIDAYISALLDQVEVEQPK